jgi:hypothetical protein
MSGSDRQGQRSDKAGACRYRLARCRAGSRGLILAKGPATARARSMNSFAVGLSIRFLRVVTATG